MSPFTKLARQLKHLTIITTCIIATLVAIRYWPREPLSTRIASSTAVFDRNNKLLRLTLAEDEQYRLWTNLDEVSPEFIEALLLHEDHHFYSHPGVDPVALVRATWATITRSSHQGGSTISMQLARLLYHLNTRSVSGKLVQIGRALQLELCYSKKDLLEAHINLLPYGNNVQGVGTASLIYFGKSAKQLSLPEALSLVLIPQSPSARQPDETEPASLIAARLRLFNEWQQEHKTTDTLQSMSLPLRYVSLDALPFMAPQFVNRILDDAHNSDSQSFRITTTLDRNQQLLLERILQHYVRDHSNAGIRNASAMLIDVRDMSVRASIGSAGFFNSSISGQVNGTTAKRSPGSALKPFIYALAMDQGLIHPLSVLKDVPTSFGAFSPENFDGRFAGPISATQALIRSRNVPAVTLSSKLGNPSLYQFLQGAGVSQMQSAQHYGLALALGGGEITMEELTTLYAMLANHGQLQPLRYRMNDKQGEGTPLLSDAASFMVLDMLQQNVRPDDAAASRHGDVHIAWKTGTSWGFRDAWTVGIVGHYVLAVWVGNFDGSSNPAFIGIQAAAPLFFRMTDALQSRENMKDIYLPPRRLKHVEVCAASGDLPNAACPQIVSTWFIPGVSPIKVSDVHRRVMIDTRTGTMACPPYDMQHIRSEVFEYWPSDLAQSFAQAGMPRRTPPVNRCSTVVNAGNDSTPHITSPVTSVTYTLRMHGESQSVPLACHLAADSKQVFWFVNAGFVGDGVAGVAIPWTPPHSGHFVISAVDDQGRSDSRNLDVEYVQ